MPTNEDFELSDLGYHFIYPELAEFVRTMFENNSCGHDFWHIYRVCKTGAYICHIENNDINVQKHVELLALIHDAFDDKLDHKIPSLQRKKMLKSILTATAKDFSANKLIEEAITLRWSNNGENSSLAAKIVMDSDRLDAIGSIGVARACAFGGAHHMFLYDSWARPNDNYKSGSGSASTITHFYDKLIKVKNHMFTETGKKLAEDRHAFMVMFLRQFEYEIHEQTKKLLKDMPEPSERIID